MNKGTVLLCMGLLSLGLAGGWFASQLFSQRMNSTFAANTPCSYKFISPYRCNLGLVRNTKQYTSLRNELLAYINDNAKKKNVTNVSIHFRDLVNGTTMSINAQNAFFPASLLKVPLLMMYYKKAEDDPNVLTRKILVDGNLTVKKQNVPPQKWVMPGQSYTINSLLDLLVTQSDNGAWSVLLDDLEKNNSTDDFVSTLHELGIIDSNTSTQDQYITTQEYSSVFRNLYESSYLDLEMSNRALELLSQSVFREGLVAGIPEGVVVAHKFGEQADSTSQQLHDCGIVYYEPNPYLLCVMTQGDSLDKLKLIIQEVSKKVYEEVARRN